MKKILLLTGRNLLNGKENVFVLISLHENTYARARSRGFGTQSTIVCVGSR